MATTATKSPLTVAPSPLIDSDLPITVTTPQGSTAYTGTVAQATTALPDGVHHAHADDDMGHPTYGYLYIKDGQAMFMTPHTQGQFACFPLLNIGCATMTLKTAKGTYTAALKHPRSTTFRFDKAVTVNRVKYHLDVAVSYTPDGTLTDTIAVLEPLDPALNAHRDKDTSATADHLRAAAETAIRTAWENSPTPELVAALATATYTYDAHRAVSEVYIDSSL